MRIFVAGATGAVGRAMTPQLLSAGHDVTAITRDASKAAALERQVCMPSSATCSTRTRSSRRCAMPRRTPSFIS